MKIDDKFIAREAISRLIFDYCTTIDSGRLDDTAKLFANGVWRPGPNLAFEGFSAVSEFLNKNVILHNGVTGTRHVVSNICIDFAGEGNSAAAESYVIVYQSLEGGQPHIIFQGVYKDSFSARDGQWQFIERRVLPDGLGDLSQHMRST